ncbi:MAG: hypothetical protein QXK86_08300 [Candidatus Bathyarchaeia archaeon]
MKRVEIKIMKVGGSNHYVVFIMAGDVAVSVTSLEKPVIEADCPADYSISKLKEL